MCRRWREIPKPTIAMVQGACIAGGLMLAWVCDLIVAADDAFFADPVVRMGIPGVEYFAHPWVLGPRVAKEILFTGDRFAAAARLRVGMVNRVVPREELADETLALAERIAAMPRVRPGAGEAGGQPVRGPAWACAPGMDSVFGLHHLAHAHNAEVGGRLARPGWTRRAHEGGRAAMDLDLSPTRGAFRAEVRDWLRAHVPAAPLPSMDTAEGFARAPRLGARAGRGPAVGGVLARGVRRPGRDAAGMAGLRGGVLRAPARPRGSSQNGIFLLAPTLFAHGTAEQLAGSCRRWPRADEIWAQAWSEPEAGSDLAAIRAARGADRRRLAAVGQKTWSSRAAFADRAFGLFRSDPEAERHAG